MFRLIANLLVVLVCVGGYLAFSHDNKTVVDTTDSPQERAGSVTTQPSAPADDLPNININK